MQTTMINHPSLTVRHLTGNEGPQHDPYQYAEYEIETRCRSIVVHIGLAVYVVIDGERQDADREGYDKPNRWADMFVQEVTSFTLIQIERIHRHLSARCSEGGEHWTMDVNGYPGEHFEYCVKCNKTVNSYFCMGAVI